MTDAAAQPSESPTGHAIIAGYGLPGRAAADALDAGGTPFCVIELNAATVTRCHRTGLRIIEGDVAQEDTLRRAGIENAGLLVLAVPNERAVLEAVRVARKLNPTVRIIARCHYTSTGMAATHSGADQVIVAEQVVAEQLRRLLAPGDAPVAAHPRPAP